MDHSFQIGRLPVLDNAKFVMENIVYGHGVWSRSWCEVFQRMDTNNK